MRRKIFNIIEPSRNATDNTKWSAVYDCFMIIVIIISLIPLIIKGTYPSVYVMELITKCLYSTET